MSENTNVDLSEDRIKKLKEALELCLSVAEDYFNPQSEDIPDYFTNGLSEKFRHALDLMTKYHNRAAGGYNNLVTSLTIKVAYGEEVDIRYHQRQIQDQTDRPAGFNFRGVSETIVYPWMADHGFPTAKSGWQTRTLERPKPYMLNYDENISTIKEPFLTSYDQIETHQQSSKIALSYLFWHRLHIRERLKITLAQPKIDNVSEIVDLLSKHFFYQFKDSKGGSRLPVLALHAIYSVLMDELNRYQGKSIKPLEKHSAADSQTGAIADIEIANPDGSVFEAVEVKHNQVVSAAMVETAKEKMSGSTVDRYYILTTHCCHEPSAEILKQVDNINRILGRQLIVDGVMPTIRYYLRLMISPGTIIPRYLKLMADDESVGFEHRAAWNQLVAER